MKCMKLVKNIKLLGKKETLYSLDVFYCFISGVEDKDKQTNNSIAINWIGVLAKDWDVNMGIWGNDWTAQTFSAGMMGNHRTAQTFSADMMGNHRTAQKYGEVTG